MSKVQQLPLFPEHDTACARNIQVGDIIHVDCAIRGTGVVTQEVTGWTQLCGHKVPRIPSGVQSCCRILKIIKRLRK